MLQEQPQLGHKAHITTRLVDCSDGPSLAGPCRPQWPPLWIKLTITSYRCGQLAQRRSCRWPGWYAALWYFGVIFKFWPYSSNYTSRVCVCVCCTIYWLLSNLMDIYLIHWISKKPTCLVSFHLYRCSNEWKDCIYLIIFHIDVAICLLYTLRNSKSSISQGQSSCQWKSPSPQPWLSITAGVRVCDWVTHNVKRFVRLNTRAFII